MNVVTTPQGRWYEKDGRWLISVTTVLDRYFDIRPDTNEKRERWAELAERGSRIHELLAKPCITLEEWLTLPQDYQRALQARQRFVDDYGFRRDDCELALADVDSGYAGRLDDVGSIPRGRVLLDYKTGRLRPRMLLMQLGAYYGLYIARYPRRKLFGALGVGISPDTGKYAVESFSLGDLKRGLAEFKEALDDTNQRGLGDPPFAQAGEDPAGHQAPVAVG